VIFANRDQIAQAFLKAVLAWKLSDEAAGILIGAPAQDVHAWHSGEPIETSEEPLARMMMVAQVRTALDLCFAPEVANQWMDLPNIGRLFNGQSPVEYVAQHGWPGLYLILCLVHAWATGN
jgi:hypothetical protein